MLAVWVLAGFVCAALAPWLVRVFRERAAWILSLYPLGAFLLALHYAPRAPVEEIVFPWLPRFGLVWGAYADGLALLFTALIGGIGFFVVLYAGAYLHGAAQLGRFFLYLLAFTASMLGLVLAHNAFMLFVCWELTSVFSYLLIGYEAAEEKARKAAWQALLTTSLGGVALLMGFLLLHEITGAWSFSEILAPGGEPPSHPAYPAAVLLLLLAAFTKSAQFPFHFWLPAAMAAPTPVSAYLHSATMVKAGVFLLARLSPVLGGSDLWQATVTCVGAATMLAGALLALPQSDGKLLLAYSTVGALGTLMFLLGLGTPEAAAAAIVFLCAHALYKGGLFLSVGVVDHETGSRDMDRLSGLARTLPGITAAVVLLVLSFAGLPPALGFVAKEQLLEAALHSTWGFGAFWFAVAVLASACQVAVAAIVLRPFWTTGTGSPLHHAHQARHAHESHRTHQSDHAADHAAHHGPSAALLAGPLALALLSLAFLAVAAPAVHYLLGPAARAVDQAADLDLALWHGLSPALAGSGLALLLGGMVFLARQRWRSGWERYSWLGELGPAAAYDRTLWLLNFVARWQTQLLQSGRLRQYAVLFLGSVVLAFFGLFLPHPSMPRHEPFQLEMHAFEISTAVAAVLGAAIALRATSRLTAIVGLGVTGYAVALLFLLFGAPDLAMTQFAVETLTVVLFMLVLYRLPRFVTRSSWRVRLRDGALALAFGGLVTVALLQVIHAPTSSRLAPYFVEASLPRAHGRNVVNVILVDFRALDTLGEITVLGIGAIGVAALIAAARRAR